MEWMEGSFLGILFGDSPFVMEFKVHKVSFMPLKGSLRILSNDFFFAGLFRIVWDISELNGILQEP